MNLKRIIRVTCSGWALVFSLFCSLPVQADELAGQGEPFRVIDISPEACAQLAPYISSGDADYKPGVAVDGSAVAPADLDADNQLQPRSYYNFQIKIDPLSGSGPYSNLTTLDVADVTIDSQTGRVTIDGRDIGTGGNRALAEACALRASKPRH
ncbi:MAG: hypothetical protein WA138_10685 [Parvibaculum sp.]